MTTGRINQVSIVSSSSSSSSSLQQQQQQQCWPPFHRRSDIQQQNTTKRFSSWFAANALSLLQSGQNHNDSIASFSHSNKYSKTENDGTSVQSHFNPQTHIGCNSTYILYISNTQKEERLPVVALGLHPLSITNNSTMLSQEHRLRAVVDGRPLHKYNDTAPTGLRDLAVTTHYTHGVSVLTFHHFLHQSTIKSKLCIRKVLLSLTAQHKSSAS